MIRVIGGTAVSYSSPDIQGACMNCCLGVWSVCVCVVYSVCLCVWSVCLWSAVCVWSVCRSERVTPTSSRGADLCICGTVCVCLSVCGLCVGLRE